MNGYSYRPAPQVNPWKRPLVFAFVGGSVATFWAATIWAAIHFT